ncbi:MAG: N-acetyltransferase family protein [Minwuia sp.]|uniref:GNAT family N-acetyltransferase n=1 Tax=Minwuia sp. TaxID=2493630 RepID=UPI003A877C11
MSAVAIRDATPDDIDAMTALLAHLFAQEAEFKPDPDRQRAGLRMILGDPAAGALLVAERDGAVIGMVGLLYSISTALGGRVAMLEDMVVEPTARGSQVGRALLDAAIARAKSDGCRRITLLTDGDNAAAQRFYARAGFQASDMLPMRLML